MEDHEPQPVNSPSNMISAPRLTPANYLELNFVLGTDFAGEIEDGWNRLRKHL